MNKYKSLCNKLDKLLDDIISVMKFCIDANLSLDLDMQNDIEDLYKLHVEATNCLNNYNSKGKIDKIGYDKIYTDSTALYLKTMYDDIIKNK